MGRRREEHKAINLFFKKWKCYHGFLLFLFGHPFRRLGPSASSPCFVGMESMLTTKDVFWRGSETMDCQGRGKSPMDEDVILMRKKINDSHGNPMRRRLPSPAMCNRHTHTTPFPVPGIQPNSHLKYRFIHFKKNLFLRKKKSLFLAWASCGPFIYKYKVIMPRSLCKRLYPRFQTELHLTM